MVKIILVFHDSIVLWYNNFDCCPIDNLKVSNHSRNEIKWGWTKGGHQQIFFNRSINQHQGSPCGDIGY